MTTETFNTVIRTVCQDFSASISSGHRTVFHNRQVGGAANSQHMGWRCVDLVLDNWGLKDEAIVWLRKMGFFVLDEVTAKNHLHVDDRFNADL